MASKQRVLGVALLRWLSFCRSEVCDEDLDMALAKDRFILGKDKPAPNMTLHDTMITKVNFRRQFERLIATQSKSQWQPVAKNFQPPRHYQEMLLLGLLRGLMFCHGLVNAIPSASPSVGVGGVPSNDNEVMHGSRTWQDLQSCGDSK